MGLREEEATGERSGWRYAIGGVWLIVLAVGSVAAMAYGARPAPEARAAPTWPTAAGLERADRWTMVVFVHAGCACTRATIWNLERLMRDLDEPPATVLCVRAPSDVPTAPWMDATRGWPDHRLVPDPRGDLARAFGVATSGHVVVYDATGRRRFDGGVTPLRGHRGSAPGLTALAAVLRRRGRADRPYPVFGCRLHDARPGHEPARERTPR